METNETPTITDRLGIAGVILLLTAFLFATVGAFAPRASADEQLAKRDDDAVEVIAVEEDDDDDDVDDRSGGSNSRTRGSGKGTKTGTTRGTGPSNTNTNDTKTGTRTRGSRTGGSR